MKYKIITPRNLIHDMNFQGSVNKMKYWLSQDYDLFIIEPELYNNEFDRQYYDKFMELVKEIKPSVMVVLGTLEHPYERGPW